MNQEKQEIAIEIRHLWKSFPNVIANKDISLSIKKGEVHAIVGENGAGKSTLMKILYGLYSPDRGEVFVFGKRLTKYSPNISIAHGIGMVHQHFMLIPSLTVAENVVLGKEPKKGLFIDKEKSINIVKSLSEKFGLFVNPEEKVSNLSVGLEQRVEIIKILYRGAKILIMDEPTAVLTPQEVEELYNILRNLKKEGKTIIFITHKLKEVMEISDRITVMKKGELVTTVDKSSTTKENLAYLMVGRDVELNLSKTFPKLGENLLEVKNLWCLTSKGVPILKGVSFSIKGGEILGIAGVEGNGQKELIEVISGLKKTSQGEVLLLGENITNLSPKLLISKGISHIPEDRHKLGLILDYSIQENLILGVHRNKKFSGKIKMKFSEIGKYAEKFIKQFDIRPPYKETIVKELSGGNQQKVIVARELSKEPKLLIASQPTRGLDIGAIEFIYSMILEERKKGKAILLISSDLSEIISLSDRIAVIYEGKILKIVDADLITEKELGLMMTGSLI